MVVVLAEAEQRSFWVVHVGPTTSEGLAGVLHDTQLLPLRLGLASSFH
jgi:hypothetical protein